jgi:Ca2+-binding RTX toxin-like protein
VPASFQIEGEGLSTYSQAGYADAGVANLIAEAKANGSNFVEFSNARMANLAAGTFSDVAVGGVDQTAPLADIGHAIDLAQAQGLSVMLKPQIVVNDPAFAQYNSAPWINMVNPNLAISDPATFFANYKNELLQWAQVAEQHHVAMLSIGNEMVAATKPQYTAYWDDIISAVRGVYHGQLTYAALAPVVTTAPTNEISQIGFWSKLDVAGFDVYPSLVSTSTPTEAQLEAGWHAATVYGNQQDYTAFLSQMASAVGKPVIFTETGLPSFAGASDRQATSDGNINDGVHPANQQEQADWWQAFFKTWAVNTPSWLKGLFVNNNDPADLGAYYATNYNINGKLAEPVVAAWYGGKTVVAPGAATLNGGQGDDQLYLYGPDHPQAANQAQSLGTTVEIKLTGSILSGTAPVLHAYINGTDEGQIALDPVDSGYVDANGVHYTTTQTFTFTLPGLVPITQLKLAMDSPASVGGGNASTFVHEISVDGVDLSSATYVTAAGGSYAESLPSGGQGGNAGQWAGGAISFDASPWNGALSARAVGTAPDPIVVNGQGGTDTVHVLGGSAQYVIERFGDGSVHLNETSGLGQDAVLNGVSAVDFADGSQVSLAAVQQVGAAYVFGGAANDVIQGGSGVQVLRGGDGADTIIGGSGFNQVNGNTGDDSIVGHSASGDWLLGGQGNDVIDATASAGHNILNGHLGADTIHAGAGGDTLRGGQGDDVLVGGAGDDWLSGDMGHDTLTGGTGADTFHVAANNTSTLITDFNVAQGDHLLLDHGSTYTVSQSGANALVTLGSGTVVTLQNVQAASLPAGAILLA